MKPESESVSLLGVTRSQAKMFEYDVPLEDHIKIFRDPANLFDLSIGLLGDLASSINRQDKDSTVELTRYLRFSAYFFDSYFQSKLSHNLDPYLILLGAASYYLCDLPGSAAVLANRDELRTAFDLRCEGLEHLLLWLLRGDQRSSPWTDIGGQFSEVINPIPPRISFFFVEGLGDKELNNLSDQLRIKTYQNGSPRQLLFGDIIGAVLRKKIENSSWNALPNYSKLPRSAWKSALLKENFIAELWPAQHLIGKENVLQGESAVIQMPTSAGKTKATELIIRSAFLAKRTSLAVVIAPFRALCHEIKNSFVSAFRNEDIDVQEISDVPQLDFIIEEFNFVETTKHVVVITPEKLLYVLRHYPELTQKIGLAIFDEGHQFDSGTRGITYELLLTSLRAMFPACTQKILISAVIANAEDIGKWLNGNTRVVAGENLSPTYRSLGFASWKDTRGRIEYTSRTNIENRSFFVPRVIEEITLTKRPRERKPRYFPVKGDGKTIALYLGLKLVSKGSVAIFCGKKSSALSICETVEDIFSRNPHLASPKDHSDGDELKKLCFLVKENLGESPAASSAEQGIFSHHGNVPHGIRLAIEYAMREGLIKFVVCTSTLAQGVNLPIRYLIVNSVYQGTEQIKVRDFHNLMGRTGRAGMHTEGSVLFADTSIYDKRNVRGERWRWTNMKTLLNPKNSEPCTSSLLSALEPIISDNGDLRIFSHEIVKDYLFSNHNKRDFIKDFIATISEKGIECKEIEIPLAEKIAFVESIESFLLYHWDENENPLSVDDAILLAEGTLAFSLANEIERQQLRDLFKLIAENIQSKIAEPTKRQTYGKTLFGVKESLAIEQWTIKNFSPLSEASMVDELIEILWNVMPEYIDNKAFNKIDQPDVVKSIFSLWIHGHSFSKILAFAKKSGVKLRWGKKTREIDIDVIVDLCENGFAFEGNLVIACINEFVDLYFLQDGTNLKAKLELFQKQMKYGLPTESAIVLYELGFSDRVVALDIITKLNLTSGQKTILKRSLIDYRIMAEKVISQYPAYYQTMLNDILVTDVQV